MEAIVELRIHRIWPRCKHVHVSKVGWCHELCVLLIDRINAAKRQDLFVRDSTYMILPASLSPRRPCTLSNEPTNHRHLEEQGGRPLERALSNVGTCRNLVGCRVASRLPYLPPYISKVTPSQSLAASMSSPTQLGKRKRHCFTRSKAGCQVCRRQKKKVRPLAPGRLVG